MDNKSMLDFRLETMLLHTHERRQKEASRAVATLVFTHDTANVFFNSTRFVNILQLLSTICDCLH